MTPAPGVATGSSTPGDDQTVYTLAAVIALIGVLLFAVAGLMTMRQAGGNGS